MLDKNIESLLQDDDVAFVLTGDLNKLNVKLLEVKHGLVQLVNAATRRKNILDVFYSTRPDLFTTDVLSSCVKTDHKAILVNCAYASEPALHSKSDRMHSVVYELSPTNLSILSQALTNYNRSGITLALAVLLVH